VKPIKQLLAIAAIILLDLASHPQTPITSALSSDYTFNGNVNVACIAGSINQTQQLRALVRTWMGKQT
jgi:hypothetical protein